MYQERRAAWVTILGSSHDRITERDEYEAEEVSRLRWQMLRRLHVPANDPVWNHRIGDRPLNEDIEEHRRLIAEAEQLAAVQAARAALRVQAQELEQTEQAFLQLRDELRAR